MIEVKDVVINYGNFTAVKGASFTVKDGDFFTLLGPSGCGKTTTLRAIAGFEKVTSGQILLDGLDIAPLSPEEREIGFVFQNYALFPSMTVYDNIAFGLKIRRHKKSEIKKRVHQIAELIGITEHLGKKISQISGGQQQRVAIARALILNPRLLLMDEPLSNLDAKLRVSMRSEIRRIQKELGIVAIYVTHDQEEAMAISDHIAVFNRGVIEQIGTPQDIYYHPKTEFTAKFVGDINEFSCDEIAQINCRSDVCLERRCFIRTEKVHICAPASSHMIPTGCVRCEGTIRSIEFLGATTKVKVSAGDSVVITSMGFDGGALACGDSVFVYFDKADILFLE
jgi:iron(III) transport system ATP-binding protein